MGAMTTILPVMSGVFCVFMPIGVGIYWVVSSGVQIVQQLAINKYLDKYDVNDIVAQNEAKIAERNEKYGVYAKNAGMSNIAKSSTRSIATIDTSASVGSGKKNNDNRDSGKSGKRNDSGRISQEKRDDLARKAADNDGKAGISAIANILKNDEDQ